VAWLSKPAVVQAPGRDPALMLVRTWGDQRIQYPGATDGLGW